METDASLKRNASQVFRASLAQVQNWIKSEFGLWNDKPLTIALVSNAQSLRQIEPQLDQERKPLAYPYIMLAPGDFSINGEMGGAKRNHATGGFVTERNYQDHSGIRENLRPVSVSIGVSFRTDSLDDVVSFVHALLMAYPKVRRSIRINGSLIVDNTILISPSLSIPPMDSSDVGQNYAFETILTLNTYIGYSEGIRLISRIELSNSAENTVGAPEEVQRINWTDYYDSSKPAYNSTYTEGPES